MLNKNMLYGGDYNPDQWLDSPGILKEDLRLMKKANVNTVTLGMFSWAKLQPAEGQYEFEWLGEIISRLYENGISVILGTPSGARPRWLAEKYPEVLRTDGNRVKQLFGMRHNHCYTSPVYREKVGVINKKLAEYFDSNPAVILWHISNEYGGECHCELCQNAFRLWLKGKYKTIGEVNRRWNTSFWSHDYTSFEQIESPSPIGELSIDGLTLDWKRFVTYQTTDFMKWEIEAIRAAGGKKPVTTNMMYNYEGLNYHVMAQELDIISWDAYPFWGKGCDTVIAANTGLQHDMMRSLKLQPFLLMESSPGATNWQPVSKLKRPGVLSAQSFQAIAHGADGVMYFQMRKGRGGAEKFHGALIDHYGKGDDRTFIECSRVGADLEKLRDIKGSSTVSKVAVLYDWENKWAMENALGPRNQGMHYYEAVKKSYTALRKQGINVDLIDMTQDLDRYELVIAPVLYMFRAGIQDKIRKFVRAGGTFIMTYWSGVVDENDLCFLGGMPGGLMDVMGLRTTEIDGLYDEDRNYIMPCFNMSEHLDRGDNLCREKYEVRNLCQLIHLDTAIPLMLYAEDFYAGTPACAVNHFGQGKAYFIGADAEQKFYDEIYAAILRELRIGCAFLPVIPTGIEVTTRETADDIYLFIQNFNKVGVCVEIMDGERIFSGQEESVNRGKGRKNIESLNPYETKIYRYRKSRVLKD